MRLGTETGSLVNHIYAGIENPEPAVGMGATILMWTDRRAATIVKVTPCQVHIQEDKATRADSNGMSESQNYDYTPDPQAPVVILRKVKGGWREKGGSRLSIGHRRAYHDYSF